MRQEPQAINHEILELHEKKKATIAGAASRRVCGTGTRLATKSHKNHKISRHNKGFHVLDFRFAFNPTEYMKIALIIKNLLNQEYMTRPGLIDAPRNVALQFAITF